MKIISTTLVVFVVGSILVIGVTKLFPESHVLAWEHPELPGDILGVSNIRRLPETQTSFDISSDVVVTDVGYETEQFDSEDYFLGDEVVVQEGLYGSITRTYDVYLWDGEEVDRRVVSEERINPQTKRIAVGTKKNYRMMDTPDGSITYYDVLSMWSTSYDGNCRGCTGKTYTGALVDHGVCAVDPRVIPLYTKMFIPGYGFCRALDIGGSIKGNKIDLGFENVKNGWWSSRWTDVYLLDE
ncbi:hypothetical protein GW793_00950 [bacterium]|uniref:G5 domain-containing protein n=3 Tax=Katanobacteria TaxID=422282 RepID=A0A2H0BGR0_UNCKA|nr:hypothetical protein [bacterium]PIP56853.1 MAG: hypothetical protein COX05_00960 [candidate division WWE3 bacterium CG22_combo_CG10-13_8_21_14_all_39_12]